MTGICARCGVDARIEEHHPTCRGADGFHLHPDFTVPLCIPCHRGAHCMLRSLGINKTIVDSPGLVLHRIAAFDSYMAMSDCPVVLGSEVARRRASALEDPVRALLRYEAANRGERNAT